MLHAYLKLQWHRDLVATPSAHAWVLNLYRAGELYPTTVDDYFPAAHAPWPWLASALEEHRRDELRHGAMLAKLVRDYGEPLRDDLHGEDVYNAVIRRCTESSFRVEPGEQGDKVRLRLAHFLAHAHHLETRVARSLELHREACELAGLELARRYLTTILSDERRHVGYTRVALFELVPAATARAVLAQHERSEARANLLFSQHQVRTYLRAQPRASTPAWRAFYRLSAAVQAEVAKHV